jgi:hypothetical protein
LACQSTVNQTVVASGGAAGSSGGGQANGGATYENVVLSDDPSLYWRELAGTGSVVDVSPKGNNGNYAGCVEAGQVSAGPILRLCGGYLYARDIFDFADTAPFTFEAWIRPEGVQPSGFARIAGKESPATGIRQGWDLIAIGWDADGGIPALSFERWYLTDGSEAGSAAYLANAALSSASFTYVAVSYDGTTNRIYVNGVSVAEALSEQAIADTTSTFRVGADPFGTYNWVGDIAEIAVYEKALLADRVAAHYDQGKVQGY